RDKYILREEIAAATELVRRAYEPEAEDEPLKVLDVIESRIASIRSLGSNGAGAKDAAEAITKQITTPEDVIDGVLHLGGKAAIGGASKSFKTWLFIDIGVSVATGSVCLNNFSTKKGKVLYANFELPESFFWKRVQAICGERQLTLDRGMLEVY